MEYFFDTEEKIDQLEKELEEWIGTPFRYKCAIKQKGVDCINFVGMAALNVGVPMTFKHLPDYVKNWWLHTTEEILYKGLKKSVKSVDMFNIHNKDLPKSSKDVKPLDGDVFLYRFGKASGHASVYCRGYVYHSLAGHNVTKSPMDDTLLAPKLTHIIRAIK